MDIGIDIAEVKRFKLKRSNSFLKNNFTSEEIEYAFSKENPEISLCGIFCAKEALIKALSNQTILLKDIEVRHLSNGKPYFRIIKKLKNNNFILSISHEKRYAVACVIKK
jgi:phosphopantetheine--protein transferase-like protein